jgi:lysine 2,3-aminomutase
MTDDLYIGLSGVDTSTESQDQLLAAQALRHVAERYAVRTTPFLDQIIAEQGPDGPLARQFVPSVDELIDTPQDLIDPIGDLAKSPRPGIVHRYADRVLLKPIHVCAAYCRFCFRREQVGPGGEALSDSALEHALDYIRETPEVWEVVLTGGDPLLMSPRRLAKIVTALHDIPHVEVLRIHSRLPIHDPEKITSALIDALVPLQQDLGQGNGLSVWLAVHINHRSELVPPVTAALARLRQAMIPLVSQTVLLKGVNDEADILCDLFRALVRLGIKPYYLHHPDPAPGTSHFRLSVEEGTKIVRAMHKQLSGLARPTYVLDRPEGQGKIYLPVCQD